jgi:acetyl-CoA synthetase
MLACARIGAVHSVVYAGLGASALRERIGDAQAEIVLTADIGYRRGRTVALKLIVDEAVDGLGIVRHVVVLSRRTYHSGEIDLREGRDLDSHALIDDQSSDCPAAIMDAEDPLFILYTSGSTGKPKGCLFVHGGYMVGTHDMTRVAYDFHENDIYWSTSDIGWIVGHSSIVYGPLANGVTYWCERRRQTIPILALRGGWSSAMALIRCSRRRPPYACSCGMVSYILPNMLSIV